MESRVVFSPEGDLFQRAGLQELWFSLSHLALKTGVLPREETPEYQRAGVEQMAPAEMVVWLPPSQEHVLIVEESGVLLLPHACDGVPSPRGTLMETDLEQPLGG